MENNLYDNPKYYEMAFSFRDIPKEVEVMKRCIAQHSWIPVESVLELACGNSPHMAELMKNGYRYVGIDLNEQMVAYSKEKACALHGAATILQGDMIQFALADPVDFAFVALGSLYAQNTKDILLHLDSLARCLKPGGLYLLDWCVSFTRFANYDESWTIERDGIRLACKVSGKIINSIEQLCEERITLDVNDHGCNFICTQTDTRKQTYPQEFLHIIERSGAFEFIGWWNNWNLEQPLHANAPGGVIEPSAINRPIALIKKK